MSQESGDDDGSGGGGGQERAKRGVTRCLIIGEVINVITGLRLVDLYDLAQKDNVGGRAKRWGKREASEGV